MPAPLRILLVLENPGAGSGRHVADLATGLVNRGDMVHLLYSPLRLQGWFEEAIYNVPNLIAHRLPMAHSPSLQDLRTAARIRSYVMHRGPFDVIHGHSSKGGALARLGAMWTDLIRVYTPHALVTLDPTLPRLKRYTYRTLERVLGHMSDGIICVSEEERNHALNLGLSAAKLFVVHNGLRALPPADRSTVRHNLGVEENALCIGFVGRLESQKCVARLITAFARIRPALPRLRLVLVGEGSESSKLRRVAENLGIQNSIRWTGQADGQALMSGFDIFALPSRYEGFAYVLLEALQRGLPIVTMDVGGAKTLVRTGHNGIIVSQGNVDAFARALLKLCKDPDLRERMAESATSLSAEFTLERMVDHTREIYLRLRERRRAVDPRETAQQ